MRRATTATAAYAGLGALLGNPEWIEPELVKVAVVVGLLAALFSPIALPIMAWTDGQPLGVRSSIGRRSPSRGRAGNRPGVLRY